MGGRDRKKDTLETHKLPIQVTKKERFSAEHTALKPIITLANYSDQKFDFSILNFNKVPSGFAQKFSAYCMCGKVWENLGKVVRKTGPVS